MISKFLKAIGFIGATAAIIWAMRDRFISVAVSREPQPPAFKATSRTAGLEAVDGIGPTYAARLSDAGIKDAKDLSTAEVSRVAEVARVGVDRAKTWIDQAASLI